MDGMLKGPPDCPAKVQQPELTSSIDLRVLAKPKADVEAILATQLRDAIPAQLTRFQNPEARHMDASLIKACLIGDYNTQRPAVVSTTRQSTSKQIRSPYNLQSHTIMQANY